MNGNTNKVAVIGAGVAGLVAARELQHEGHVVTVYEKNDKVGGTWLYDSRVESDPVGLDPTREIIHSSMYKSLRTNLPRQLMEFSDYPFEKRENGDPRTFPCHEEVLWFLNKFAEDYQITELIRFGTDVVRVEQVNGCSESWVIESRTRGCYSTAIEVFDAVVVCTGQNTEPRVAEIPGIEKWPGNQMHSHNYRVPEPFSGQVVVIIGNGPSSWDISREIATAAKEVHIATRAPDAHFSKLDDQNNNIWLHKMVECVSDDGKLLFQDGSSTYADTIFYCTGYKFLFPFLNTNGVVTIDEGRVGPLYKHVFPPSLSPSLSFIGLVRKGVIFDAIEIQSKWLARVLSGKIQLPSEEEMMNHVEDHYKQMEETGVPKRYTHVLYPKEVEYKNGLLDEMGLPRLEEWKRKLFAKCIEIYKAMEYGYRDCWDDDYWNAIVHKSS